MADKILISPIRAQQFNKMVELLRDIRRYDVNKKVSELKKRKMTREQAFEFCMKEIQQMAKASRGIAELR